MQLLILSDIHGNVSAFDSVMSDVKKEFHPDAIAFLGDYIDYGMRSNEVLETMQKINIPIVCALWGNHEYAILNEDYNHFSTQRGIQSAKRTRKILSKESVNYLNGFRGKNGSWEFEFANKKFLAVHGNKSNPLWGSISACKVQDNYFGYDYVLSGHTHYAHSFPVFYETNDVYYRNKKRTLFINPGSVGQPRNHNPKAQYAILDIEKGVFLRGVDYDVEYEQSLFTNDVDVLYKDRLIKGV